MAAGGAGLLVHLLGGALNAGLAGSRALASHLAGTRALGALAGHLTGSRSSHFLLVLFLLYTFRKIARQNIGYEYSSFLVSFYDKNIVKTTS